MTEVAEATTTTPTELLASGRRHLAVRDYTSAVEVLAKACEALAKEHGDTADQCAEAYLWYGKSLLGLSREESGVLGDGVPGSGNADEEEDNEEQEENGETEDNSKEADSGTEDKFKVADSGTGDKSKENGVAEAAEAESTTKDEEMAASSSTAESADEPGTSNGEAADESVMDDAEDDVDNLQLAWEMLDLARSILSRRVELAGGDTNRALLADVHLALGEVALESETYDKAVIDMQSCLELQKELYRSDDRRIAETHYQIGLANSLASNFEDAITHFKNAANILETRIKILENPAAATEDATVKKFTANDPFYTVESEIKELKELLPEIKEKIQDMMDYKAETIRRVRETLCPSNGDGPPLASSSSNGAGSSAAPDKPAATNISHLIKRKRKSSESGGDGASTAKRSNS